MKTASNWLLAGLGVLGVSLLFPMVFWAAGQLPESTYPKLQIAFTLLGGAASISALSSRLMSYLAGKRQPASPEKPPAPSQRTGPGGDFGPSGERMVDRLKRTLAEGNPDRFER